MKKIRISSAIGLTVLLFALTVSLLAWPLGKIKYTEKSGRHDKMTEMSENIDIQARAQQTFVPKYKDLQAIHIYIASELPMENEAVLSVTFFDKDLQVISLQELPLTGQAYPGYLRVPTDSIQFVPGDSYYYLVGAMKEPLSLAYTDVAETETIEGLETYYAEKLQEDRNLLTVYEYRAPFHWQNALVLALLCFAGSTLLTIVSELLCRYFKINIKVPLGTLFRIDATIITAVVSMAAFIAVGPMQMFTKSVIDILFLETGIVLFTLTCLYLLYGKKSGTEVSSMPCEQSGDVDKTFSVDVPAGIDAVTLWLQKFAFAGSILACCHYGNALYTAGQESASAWIFGCFAAAIVCCFVFGICRIVSNRAAHRKMRFCLSISYALLTVLVFALLLLFQNERAWVFKAVIPFTLFYIGVVFAGNSKKIMKNLIDGIIISFVLLTGYCLIHRPYHYYRFNRYPMYFHTVTVTGMYLILVISAAFTKFLAAWKQEVIQTETLPVDGKVRISRKNIVGHTLMLGVTLSYLLMAVSRIGMVTMLFIFAALLLLTAFTAQDSELTLGKKLLFAGRDSVRRFVWIAAGLLWCFPICFTATRIIPAVVMQPERTELEEWPPYSITAETPPDSDLYMTFPAFVNLTLNRVSTSAEEITFHDLFAGKKEEEITVSANEVSANEIKADTTVQNADIDEIGAKVEGAADANEENTEPETIAENLEDTKDYSNGRRDIWELYLQNLNMDGHLTMQPDKSIAHAHNTYLQSAYDHGILFGIVFLIFCVLSGCKAMHYYIVRKKDEYAVFPLIIMLAFGMTGMVEWVFHPCIPLGFTFLAVISVLIGQPLQRKRYRKRTGGVQRSNNE